jgi:hypothetical protein
MGIAVPQCCIEAHAIRQRSGIFRRAGTIVARILEHRVQCSVRIIRAMKEQWAGMSCWEQRCYDSLIQILNLILLLAKS